MPNGGWLDGALNVMAGVEVVRRIAEEGTSPVTVGSSTGRTRRARFGRSLFGSSAAAGSMADQDELRQLVDANDVSLPEALASTTSTSTARSRRARARVGRRLPRAAHRAGARARVARPLGAVLGTFGVERHRITWRGQAAHAGSTPMTERRDALAGAAKLALEIREIARRTGGDAVYLRERLVQAGHRHVRRRDRRAAPRPARPERRASQRCSPKLGRQRALRGGGADRGRLGQDLVDRADPLRRDAARLLRRGDHGGRRQLASAAVRPLHDAAEVSRAGIPTVMLFVQSLRGVSHTKLEDTKEEHLELAVSALDRLTAKTVAWVADGGGR